MAQPRGPDSPHACCRARAAMSAAAHRASSRVYIARTASGARWSAPQCLRALPGWLGPDIRIFVWVTERALSLMRFLQKIVTAAGRVCLRAHSCAPPAARRHSTGSSRDTHRHRLDFISLFTEICDCLANPCVESCTGCICGFFRLQQRQRAGCAHVNTRMYVGICCSGKPHTFKHASTGSYLLSAPFLRNARATFPYSCSFCSSSTMTTTVTQALLSDSSLIIQLLFDSYI